MIKVKRLSYELLLVGFATTATFAGDAKRICSALRSRPEG